MLSSNLSVGANGHLFFRGHDTVALAQEYGTPLYLLDEVRIRENMRMYLRAFSEHFGASASPLYASKASCFKRMYEIAREEGMGVLAEDWQGEVVPSRAFAEGGIHEAIMEYENNVFFDILAEDLARRDMDDAPIDESNYDELTSRIDAYIAEFEQHGTDNILVDLDTP